LKGRFTIRLRPPTKWGSTAASGGHAIATSTGDVSDAPQWAFGEAALDTVGVQARSDRPLFIGIAHANERDRYLGRIEHDRVAQLTYDPFHVDSDHADGYAPRGAPGERVLLGRHRRRQRLAHTRLGADRGRLARCRHERRRLTRRHRRGRTVVVPDDKREYECEYGLVSVRFISLQFVAA
jgi:hypothetical protein